MMIRIGKVAEILDRSPLTIKRWYAWQEEFGPNPTLGELPTMHRKGPRMDRYFDSEDIPKLIHFRDQLKLNPGIMKEFNRRFKGENGKLTQERAEFKELLRKYKNI